MKRSVPYVNYYIQRNCDKRRLKGKPNRYHFVPEYSSDARWFTLPTLRLFLTTLLNRRKDFPFKDWEFLEYHTDEKYNSKLVKVKTLQEILTEEKYGEYVIKLLKQ